MVNLAVILLITLVPVGGITLAKEIKHKESYLMVGNPKVFDEYVKDLAKRKPEDKRPIRITPSSFQTKMPTVTDTIIVDIDHDGLNDIITGQAYRIGYGDRVNPHQWVTFTSIHFGAAKNAVEAKTDSVDASLSVTKPKFTIYPT